MFYEAKNSLGAGHLRFERGTDFQFPLHLHSSYEFITVTDGEMLVTVDGRTYTLMPGRALLLFPNQMHSLATPARSSHFLCIFSPDLVGSFARQNPARLPESAQFSPDPALTAALMRLDENSSPLECKGLLYLLCAAFDRGAQYVARAAGNDDLLRTIFRFVEENWQGDCSLGALAAATSYHYVYLSKFFRRRTGISFTDYVMRHRLSEACGMLRTTDRTVLQVALDCGFDSLRSFNRNFAKWMKLPPSEYRNRTDTVMSE